jgi:drug/metabolite transporter (DMT)-like permease
MLSETLKPVLIMITGMMFIPLGDAAGKLLIVSYGAAPQFVGWSRFFLGIVFIMAVYLFRGFDLSILKNWRVWVRGILVTGAISNILIALETETLANTFAAFFIGPIVAYFVSAILLKEEISKSRTALLFFGFVGMLLVIKPGISFTIGTAHALLSGVFYGCFLVSTKWLAGVTNARSLLVSHLIIGSIFMAPIGLSNIPDLSDPTLIFLVLLSAIASAIGNLLLVMSNKMADASMLAPLVYTQLISATLLGILVFGDVPDWISMVGLSMLLFSGLYGFYQKAKTL